MKIDLHCHTKAVKTGDGIGRNVNAATFVSAVQRAGVEIVAITNHNVFDLDQYKEFVKEAAGVFRVWPGVELDMRGDNTWHLIVICDPNEADGFFARISGLIGGMSPDDVSLTISEVVSAVDSLNVLYIPHAHGKRSGKQRRDIPDEERDELVSLVSHPNRIIFEPHHHSLGALSRHGYRVILGSDVKDWADYGSCQVSDLRFPVSSYASFCRLVEGDVATYNDTILNAENGTMVSVVPAEGAKQRTLTLYRGVNVIFGQKGMGKTKLVESMAEALKNDGANVGLYRAAEVRPMYEAELKPDRSACDADKVGADSCAAQFDIVSSWKETVITPFSDYVEYAKNTEASRNRRRLVIADVGRTELFERQNELVAATADKRCVKKAVEELFSVKVETYVGQEAADALNKCMIDLVTAVEGRQKDFLIEKYAIKLLNFSIQNIKMYAESLCGAPSSPNGTGFRELGFNRLDLTRSCEKILDNINGKSKSSQEHFGDLDDKGEILMETVYVMFKDSKSEATCFGGNKSKLVEGKRALSRVQAAVWDNDLTATVDSLRQKLTGAGVLSLDAFVGVKKQTVVQTGDVAAPYVPSDGELAIIMLRRFLSENYDCYLLDEPERGMGNSFVDSNIRPDIIRLAEKRKTVMLATHNANLAVRTMPVYTMLTEYHDKNNYAIYQGSPFSDRLVSMDDPSDVRPWTKTSMEILEGGEPAFYDRKDMYELDK